VRFGGGKAVVPVSGGNAVVLTNAWACAAIVRTDHAAVASNTLSGGGVIPTWFVHVIGDVVADANQCTHVAGRQPTAVHLEASSATVATTASARASRSS
jgi:hypothetical protein